MICPLISKADNPAVDCVESHCRFWDSKAEYNPETKQFEGQCCILTLAQLKISGGINTHAY